MPWLTVQDCEDTAITLAWEAVNNAARYEIQIQEGSGDWAVVSDSLKSTMVRKKNLKPGTQYAARVRARDSSDANWGEFSSPTEFHTLATGTQRMEAPTVMVADGEGITVNWKEAPGAASYEVQWRSDLHPSWELASSTLKGTAVRKKNLQMGAGHYFRVKPSSFSSGGDVTAWAMSPPSQSAHLSALSPYVASLLGGPEAKLINNQGKEVAAKTLAGHVILLYASASWCGPCRQFTPALVNFYVQMKASKKLPIEIVLLSADRDESSFKEYFGHMPWLAVPFGSDAREQAMGTLQVKGIPHLAVFSRDGTFLEDKIGPGQLNEATMNRWLQGLKSH